MGAGGGGNSNLQQETPNMQVHMAGNGVNGMERGEPQDKRQGLTGL